MRWSLLVILALQAAMCGQKGPLYLPDQKQHAAAAVIDGTAPVMEPAAGGRRS